jgi:hypothetical protein
VGGWVPDRPDAGRAFPQSWARMQPCAGLRQHSWMNEEEASTPLVLVSAIDAFDDSRHRHARAASNGTERRIARGAYVNSAEWAVLDARERYVLLVRAVSETRRRRLVLSHWSAAAVHGLPHVGPWPEAVHVTIGPTSGGRSHPGVVKHGVRLNNDEIVEIDGMLLTSVARTAVDLAAIASFTAATVILDRARWIDRRQRSEPLTTIDEIDGVWRARGAFRGHARARAAIDFSTTNADSPLESISRVNMMRAGCPPPVLQSSYGDYSGVIGEVDFDWPEYGLVGESDGRQKYADPVLRAGRSVEEVLLREKDRGDRLQALGKRVIRWGWSVGTNPGALKRHLGAAGLPVGKRWH